MTRKIDSPTTTDSTTAHPGGAVVNTEVMDPALLDLDLRSTGDILNVLLERQQQAVNALKQCASEMEQALGAAAETLGQGDGRLVLAGAGASGRLAVQDGAEMWPTYGWPSDRLELVMAGGEKALIESVEGVEDDAAAAIEEVETLSIDANDVVVALAASGRSPWTVAWMKAARSAGAVTVGAANNASTPLLDAAEFPIFLDSGPEVLAGSTRMAAGTAQKVFLNLFSTTLMVRLNRTYGNLMVDMAAVNKKLDDRRVRMLQRVNPELSETDARSALQSSGGWVKLAALVATGLSADESRVLLEQHNGSLRAALQQARR